MKRPTTKKKNNKTQKNQHPTPLLLRLNRRLHSVQPSSIFPAPRPTHKAFLAPRPNDNKQYLHKHSPNANGFAASAIKPHAAPSAHAKNSKASNFYEMRYSFARNGWQGLENGLAGDNLQWRQRLTSYKHGGKGS